MIYFSGFNTFGNIWDYASTQLNTMQNNGLFVFIHLNAEKLHVFKSEKRIVFSYLDISKTK